MRRICFVTGTRADYGLLRPLLALVARDPSLELQLVATGMHLSPEFGLTWREIEGDGFPIHRRIETLLSSDTPAGVAKATGLGVIGFADALQDLRPDLLVLLGDRFEILAAATAALFARVPIAHIAGGETTEGAVDEALRHSITKMAHLHFVGHDVYARRVIQLGEDPSRVFTVGGLGVDALAQVDRLDRAAFEASIGFPLGARNLLVTFHPVTLETATAGAQFQALLDALETVPDVKLIFTKPNADTDGRVIGRMIDEYVARRPSRAVAFDSLGHRRYVSALALVDGVVGNSSSGLAEAPSFRIGTVNIGDRQRGRLRAKSVIDCPPERGAITEAIARLFSGAFREGLDGVNPYGDGGASRRIHEVLRDRPLAGLVVKRFHDLPASREPG
jgi:GDP/UDP-N,N'-diacetylbacillosamine 2-epimerase (hydrolysing)